jgi:hypothetical protein
MPRAIAQGRGRLRKKVGPVDAACGDDNPGTLKFRKNYSQGSSEHFQFLLSALFSS